jgi:uncharacterized protein with ATP-grasp and redox domains
MPPPSFPLPPPYLCSSPASFAESTLLVRLPEIARRIISENHFSATIHQNIAALIADLPDGIIRNIEDPGAPDLDLWKAYLAPYLDLTWRQLSFLVCENTFYRRVLASTGYYQNGPTHHLDPYAYQKKLGLETSRKSLHALITRLDAWRAADFPAIQALTQAIETTLWSNRADLSLWPADAETTLSHDQLHQADEFLLANDLPETVQTILRLAGDNPRIDFLIDNAGYELVCDLALADGLLGRGWAKQVRFHLKAHPTFVSDALTADVKATVEFLQTDTDTKTAAFGSRLAQSIREGKLVLIDNFFWNSPLAGWEMPASLEQELAGASLVISKGDANYRRLVGDLHWPETTPFAKILAYFPTHLAALRTAKSEVVVGLREGQVRQLNQKEPDWRTNGRWGLVQLK